jgi:hypothetical protein
LVEELSMGSGMKAIDKRISFVRYILARDDTI